jgi:hypothetical protein
VTYRDKQYLGKHPALVTQTLFDRVQDVLRTHNGSGERDRKHSHYLKGTLYCGECGGRLVYSRNTRNGGVYEYFVCAAKQFGECSQRYKRVDDTAEVLEAYYGTIVLSEPRAARIRDVIRREQARLSQTSTRDMTRRQGVLPELKQQEKLLDLYYRDRVTATSTRRRPAASRESASRQPRSWRGCTSSSAT